MTDIYNVRSHNLCSDVMLNHHLNQNLYKKFSYGPSITPRSEGQNYHGCFLNDSSDLKFHGSESAKIDYLFLGGGLLVNTNHSSKPFDLVHLYRDFKRLWRVITCFQGDYGV
jgi:hypothetical protein